MDVIDYYCCCWASGGGAPGPGVVAVVVALPIGYWPHRAMQPMQDHLHWLQGGEGCDGDRPIGLLGIDFLCCCSSFADRLLCLCSLHTYDTARDQSLSFFISTDYVRRTIDTSKYFSI